MVLIHLFRNESGKKTSLFYILRLTFFLFLFVISPFSVQYIHAAEVTLAWDQNSEPDIAGYRIYYGQESRSYTNVVDVGNYTSCVVADLEDGQTYYFAATAYNTDNYESEYSNEVSYTGSSTDIINEPPVADAGHEQTVADGLSDGSVSVSGSGSGDDGGGGCFIATAAYGSDMAKEVIVLKKFRDDYLLKTSVGKKFVRSYYQNSPPIAAFIKDSEFLKSTVRIVLTPMVFTIKLMFPPNDGHTGKSEIKEDLGL